MSPPNQTYAIDPVTHTPEEMMFDLGVLPAGLTCPHCGSALLARIGSEHFPGSGNVRCIQCGLYYELA